MVSVPVKIFCAKCRVEAGIVMCHGCKHSFDLKHFNEHRQELAQQINDVRQDHDFLRQNSTNEQDEPSLLARIDQWEKESITKIQVTAEVARKDLRQLFDKTKHHLETSSNKISEELQKSQESGNYTEVDIKNWTDQLQELRQMVNNLSTVDVSCESNAQTAIQLIQVSNQQVSKSFDQASQLHESNNRIYPDIETFDNERFYDIFGKVTLSEAGLVATCTSEISGRFYVAGKGQYSSGIHRIHFRVEQMSKDLKLFFGIINSSETLTKDILQSKSSYGWRDINSNIVSGNPEKTEKVRIIQTWDEVILTLDCNKQRIQLEHHRTDTSDDVSVNLQLCPFPWKIIVLLRNRDDCIRILS